MKFIYKISSLAIAVVLAGQSFLVAFPALANTAPSISRTEFSDTSRNADMTNKVEVFPSPIYTKDLLTREWMPNWEGENEGYPVFRTSVSEASPPENLAAEQKLVAGTTNF